MYPNPGGPGQHPHQQGQPPVKWDGDPNYRGGPPPNPQQFTSPYLQQRPDQQQTLPGQPLPRLDRPEMAPIHHQQQQHPQQHHQYPPPMDPYRNLPPVPSNLYPPQVLQDPYRNQAQGAQNLSQSAPRQRTAIACKYCRRRKIRCSGFEHSEDGRCSNCVRFSQECIFTPVSAQAQAFVPAQAVYGRNARGPAQAPMQLYGAYGQPFHPGPLPPQGYGLPSPGGHYAAHPSQQYPPPGMYQQPPYEAQSQPQPGRRRRTDEPHVPTLPPPNPGPMSHLGTRDQEGQAYAYPDPTSFTNVPPPHSPASSTTSYQSHQPQPYYAPQPVRRTSPGSIYSYEQTPESASPHVTGGYGYPQQIHAPPPSSSSLQAATSQAPPRSEARTPPPAPGSDQGGTRSGLRISEMVSESGSGGERSAADSDMVSALNRRAQEPNRRS